jgi:proline iminopeptidase
MKKTASFISSFALLIVILFLNNCQQRAGQKLPTGEGFINVDGGKVWYKVTGEGEKTPIILLHGGPGIPSYYLKPLGALGKDRQVIFYDQLGCGKSDRITDTSIMTVAHFVEELKQVVNHFGLKEFYVYGHSWGSMLGTDYYLKYPQGIKALIFSGAAISIPMWVKDADTLIATMPDSVQQAIRTNEKNKTYDAPAYQQAIQAYYEKFVARKLPWSADMDSCFSQMGANVYMYMGGPSEFTIVGEMKNYDRTNRLGEIKVPTLFIAGEYDEARPGTTRYYQSLVPGAKFEMIEGAAHLTTQDKPEQTIKVVEDFLSTMETKK